VPHPPPMVTAIMVSVLMLSSGLAILPSGTEAVMPVFGIGDWTITGSEVLQDDGLILAGNIVVQAGGSLTLSNASLQFNCRSELQYGITVNSGGTLKIGNGSVVGPLDSIFNIHFNVSSGANIDFQDSLFLGNGMKIRANPVTIRNCTFTGEAYANRAALFILSDATINDCVFMNNYIGVDTVDDSDLLPLFVKPKLIRCKFTANRLCGFWADFAYPTVSGCEFFNNGAGIMSDTSVVTVQGSDFTTNTGDGIFVALVSGTSGASTIKASNCEFTRNRIGICSEGGGIVLHGLTMENCNFTDNYKAGVEWWNRPPAGYPAPANPPPNARWTVSGPSTVVNSTMQFNGSIDVTNGGSLTFKHSNLWVDNSWDGENGIEVKAGGALSFLDGSALKAFNASYRYALACRAGSSFKLEDSLLRDCGWDATKKEIAGPLMETGNVRIIDSTVDFNQLGLNFLGSRGAVIDRSSVRGMEKGLVLNDARVELLNSSVATVNVVCVAVDGSSTLEALNSTLNRNALEFGDRESMVNISWYVHARAVWADGRPVEGANLTLLDSRNSTVVNRSTDVLGWARDNALKETSIALGTSTDFTPHRFNCTRGAITNTSSLRVDRSQSVIVRLADDEAPMVAFTYPLPGASLNLATVNVNGTATDNLAVDRVVVVLDGYKHMTALEDLADQELKLVDWNLSLELKEGLHTLEAIAYDSSGNSDGDHLVVTIDTVAPGVRIYSPLDRALTNASLITVLGVSEPGSNVFLQGNEVKTERDTWSGSTILSEGDNTIMAVATDAAGNSNSTFITVRLDTLPPALDVISPQDNITLNIGMIDVFGEMENGSQIFVNGRRVALTGAPGMFRTTIALTSDVNLVSVEAVDQAGNRNVIVRRVILDTRAPLLQIMWPPDGLQTNQRALLISGITEGGANVSFGVYSFTVPGEGYEKCNFTIPVTLAEGQNTLVVQARDAARNLNATTRHVLLDTQAPPLRILEPAPELKSQNGTVYIVGETEPGATVMVNGEEIPVGYTGSFSLETSLSTGLNRLVVRATDSAGNWRETTVNVTRLPVNIRSTDNISSGAADWGFILFVMMAVCAMTANGYVAMRQFRRRAPGPGGV
jgi:hypothetical protein